MTINAPIPFTVRIAELNRRLSNNVNGMLAAKVTLALCVLGIEHMAMSFFFLYFISYLIYKPKIMCTILIINFILFIDRT